jgi:hypothetical protein
MSEQSGSMCPPCTDAGNLLGDYRKKKTPLTTARKNRILRLHAKCKGRNHCFCQHRVPNE